MRLFLGISINAGLPLWQAWGGLGLVVVGILLFRWVAVSEGSAKMLTFVEHHFGGRSAFSRLGEIAWMFTLVGLSLPLILALFGGILAGVGFMNRIIIDDVSISIHQGRQPVKRQVWEDLEEVADHPQMVILRFKEAKRYEVTLSLLKDQLGEDNTKLLLNWLEQRSSDRASR